jgi:hypothetical protein
MSVAETSLSDLCGPWCAFPLKLTKPLPTPSKYRWVLNKQNKPDHINLVAIEKFQKADKAKASLRNVFAFMNEKLKTVTFPYDFSLFMKSPNSVPADYTLLKKLDSAVTEKYQANMKSKGIIARIMDLFLSIIDSTKSLKTI